MPKVAIPATHFTHSVKKNYQEHRSALIREFLQNSVDAGSTKIQFEFDEANRSLTVQDDGCGMSKDILVSALLTMSGSYKEGNAIGGFGAAKEILLFQHHEYRVTTRQNGIVTTVIGRQLDYDFVEGWDISNDGTVFTILFHGDYDLDRFESIALTYLRECETNATIMWNGIEVKPLRTRGDFIDKGLDWAEVYVNKSPFPLNYAQIRINGVKMFSVYVNETNYDVVVEVTKPSLEILTVNRDGFTFTYQQQLSSLVYEISVDKGQFGKAYDAHKVWRGSNESYDDICLDFDCVLEHTDQKFGEYETKHFMRAMKEVAEAAMSQAVEEESTHGASEVIKERVRSESQARNIPNELIDRMISHANELVCDHAANFYIKVTGIGFDKIPDNLRPGNWGKRTVSWAKLWKHCIKIVMKTNSISTPYSIGWVIDNDEKTEAMHMKVDGVSIFYMNPMLTWMRSSNHANVFHKMLMNACHEVAHMTHPYHDERFIIHYENMLHRALCYLNKTKNSWWKEYLASKKESI